MSLHQLAHHMKNAGRGEDKMLMHMTPGEVHGLQKLAMAHGGSLTINPETGLPEAGILSSILPMIAGFALGPGGFQLMSAMNAGLAVGAVGTLATGSLSKGLMMGLGAYGGAGLGGGLESLGSAAAGAGNAAGTAAGTAAGSGVSALPIQGSANIVPTITKGAADAVGAVPGLNRAGAFTAYESAALGQNTMPIQNRVAGQARDGADAYTKVSSTGHPLDEYLASPSKAADINLIDPPAIDTRPLNLPNIKTGAYGQTDATTQQMFAPRNIAPVSAPPPVPPMASPQPSMDATTQQLFRTPSPYTPQMPGDATNAQMFKDYTAYKAPSVTDLGTKLPPIEERLSIANKIINTPDTPSNTMKGLKQVTSGGMQGLKDLYGAMDKKDPYSAQALGYSLLSGMNERPKPKGSKALIRPYTMKRNRVVDSDVGPSSSAERRYFEDVYTAGTPYEAPGPEYMADGGIVALAAGGYMDGIDAQSPVDIDSGNQFAAQQQHAYPSMQAPSPLQNTFAESNNMMMPQEFVNGGIASFAGGGGVKRFMGGGMPSASDTYRDGSGFDVSGAAEALGGELPRYKYLGNNQYELIKPDAKTGTATVSKPVSTVEELNAIYQKYLGRDSDPTGQRIYMNRRNFTPEYIAQDIQKSEEYKPIGLRLAEEKKVEDARLAEEAKIATYANPTQIANVYDKVFGRAPDMGGLDYYSGQNLTPAEIEQQLRQSDEYKTNLTKPFVPAISYTGSKLSYDDINKQLGRNATYKEVKAAGEAFIPNRATIQGAPEYQTPEQQLGLAPTKPRDQTPDFYDMMDKELRAQGGYAAGGDVNAYSLGGYSDGGRLLRGPGDGVSDSIPASIGDRQPARLADGEFVIPARIVSELGNGSTEAGAKRLYAMMDRVQKARRKTVGKGKVAVNSKADKHLPA